MTAQIIQITSQLLKKKKKNLIWLVSTLPVSSLGADGLSVSITHPSLGLIKNNFSQSRRTVMAGMMRPLKGKKKKKKGKEFWLMAPERRRLTCSCGVNACGEVPRRRLNMAHLRRRPPRQRSHGGDGGGGAAGTGCQTVHSCSLNYLCAQERG